RRAPRPMTRDDNAELAPVDRAVFADRYGPRALVAGGATGMGAEYCRQIAALGLDLLVLDRDEPALDATAGELRSAPDAGDLVLAEGLWYELRDRGVDVIAIRPGSTRTPGWQSTQPASGDLRGVMEPADVVRDALAALGTTPSIAAGAANRAAEAMFRGMQRR